MGEAVNLIRYTRQRVFLYIVLALVSTSFNLGSQWCVNILAKKTAISPEAALWPAIFVGTATGLVIKYILDKRFIFEDTSSGALQHGKKFSLYVVMGLATTVIFWGAELISFRISPNGDLKYLGGGFGLAFGYVIKFELDRRFVFNSGPAPTVQPDKV